MIIEKIVAPSKMQKEPQKTIWIADLESGKEIWIQVNKDSEDPNWRRFGELCEIFVVSKDIDISENLLEAILNIKEKLKEDNDKRSNR